MSARYLSKFSAVVLLLCVALTSGWLHAQPAEPEAIIDAQDTGSGQCTISVAPGQGAACTNRGQGDICVNNDSWLNFEFSGGIDREFYIVPDPYQNPLFTDAGSGKCKARSNQGRLKCKVRHPSITSEEGYKFWVFVDGCAQPLDPRIFIN